MIDRLRFFLKCSENVEEALENIVILVVWLQVFYDAIEQRALLEYELLREKVCQAGRRDWIAVRSQFAQRSHRKWLVLSLFQLFEGFDALDIFVVNIYDLVAVKELLFGMDKALIRVLGGGRSVFVELLFIIDEKFLVEKNLWSAGPPWVGHFKALLKASWEQGKVVLTERQKSTEVLLLFCHLIHTAGKKLIDVVLLWCLRLTTHNLTEEHLNSVALCEVLHILQVTSQEVRKGKDAVFTVGAYVYFSLNVWLQSRLEELIFMRLLLDAECRKLYWFALLSVKCFAFFRGLYHLLVLFLAKS